MMPHKGNFLAVTLLFGALALVSEAQVRPPHIISLIADDLGWGSVEYHRTSEDDPKHEVQTPNINVLVAGGIELDRLYAYKSCSPSRCSFQTGRLPVHVNLNDDSPQVFNPADPMSGFAGIPRNMTCIASKLKQAGYQTHMVGKWDAGMAIRGVSTPAGRGYDSSLNYFHHTNDYWSQVEDGYVDLYDTIAPAYSLNGTARNTSLGPLTAFEEYTFASRALDIIDKHDPNVPLFLNYNFHLPSEPLQSWDTAYDLFTPIVVDDYFHSRQTYTSMVFVMDLVVGNITNLLKAKGMWENTIITFHSDNGGASFSSLNHTGNNYPLRGSKTSNWEGGVRVPGVIAGGYLEQHAPKMIGKKITGLAHVADFYATFCTLAGVNPNDTAAAAAGLPPIDSISMWDFWTGKVDLSPRMEIHLDMAAAIMGDYKIVTEGENFACWSGPQYPNGTVDPQCRDFEHCENGGCLFNIRDDPLEARNLANQNPLVLREMQEKLEQWNKQAFLPDRGLPSSLAAQQAVRNGGFWGPFAN